MGLFININRVTQYFRFIKVKQIFFLFFNPLRPIPKVFVYLFMGWRMGISHYIRLERFQGKIPPHFAPGNFSPRKFTAEIFPWENQPLENSPNRKENSPRKIRPLGKFPQGNSPLDNSPPHINSFQGKLPDRKIPRGNFPLRKITPQKIPALENTTKYL